MKHFHDLRGTLRASAPSWRTLLLMTAALLTACSSQDCGCDGFEARPYPPQHYDKTLRQATQVRISPTGLDFIEQSIEPLVEEALPGGLSFCLPKDTTSATKLCFPYVSSRSGHHSQGEQPMCDAGGDGCQLNLVIEGVELRPVPPQRLEADVYIGNLNPTIPFETSVPLLGTVRCDVTAYKAGSSVNTPATIRAVVPVDFTIDEMSPLRDVRLNLQEIQINLTDLDIDLKGGTTCAIADALRGFFRGFLEDEIRAQLKDAVDDVVRENLCLSCADNASACPDNAMCAADGVCMYNQSAECVPAPLGIEGRLNVSELVGEFTETREARVDVLLRAADLARVDTGLTLGLRSGFQPESFGRCVPVDPTRRPSLAPIPVSPTITGDVKPGTNTPFMVGIGIHKRLIEHALWGIWGSGGTCLAIDSSASPQLSTAALGLVLRSISRLADGQNRQAQIKIVPQKAPTILLGPNRVSETADGYTVEEGLMTIDWRDLDLHIYAWVQDRWTRLVTVRMDLILPVAVVPDGLGKVSVVLGDIEGAIQNLRPSNNKILEENPDRLANLIPTLLGLALPALGDALDLAFDLPEFAGLRVVLQQGDITSVDNNELIGMFANLELAAMSPNSHLILPEPHIVSSALAYPGLEAGETFLRPVLMLEVEGVLEAGPARRVLEAGDEVEFAWRVDGGFWSLYSKRSTLEIRDPLLALPGEHEVEVRARVAGRPELANRAITARHTVRVDYQAPTLNVERDGTTLRFVAHDLTDSPAELLYRWRMHEGVGVTAWSDWSHTASLDLEPLRFERAARVEVEARDRAGFVARDEQTVRLQALEATPTPAPTVNADGADSSERASSCAQAPGGAPAGSPAPLSALLALSMLGVVGTWRKRRALLGALAIGLGLSASGCGGCRDDAGNTGEENNKPGATCTPACGADEVCVNGTCARESEACGDDAACGEGQVCQGQRCVTPECTMDEQCAATCGPTQRPSCVDNACACRVFCEAGCGDDAFCCAASDACQPYPEPCAGLVCEPGFEPDPGERGTADSTTCMVSGASCACVSLPPLPIGLHGRYADLAMHQGKVVTSAYNETYGDLMIGQIEKGGAVSWQFVDGLPEGGDIEGALDGPRGGVKDRGPNVGSHTALAFDAQGVLHVLYRDEDNAALKYGRGTLQGREFSFELTTLDAEGDAARWSDVVFSGGLLHVVYQASAAVGADPEGPRSTQLRYATIDPAAPVGTLAASFAPAALLEGSAARPCASACGMGEVCLRDVGACAAATTDCAADCATGAACYMGVCEPVYEPTAPRAAPQNVGNYLELTAAADGRLLLVFFDGAQRSVGWLVRETSGEWGMPQYVGAPSGPYVTGQLDATGQLHLAYMREASFELVYEAVGAGAPQVVHNGLRDTGSEWLLARIGEDVALMFDGSGSPVVVYHDATLHQLLMSRRENGAWTAVTLSQNVEPFDGSHGFYASLLRDTSSPMVVEYVLNSQARPVFSYPAFVELP